MPCGAFSTRHVYVTQLHTDPVSPVLLLDHKLQSREDAFAEPQCGGNLKSDRGTDTLPPLSTTYRTPCGVCPFTNDAQSVSATTSEVKGIGMITDLLS